MNYSITWKAIEYPDGIRVTMFATGLGIDKLIGVTETFPTPAKANEYIEQQLSDIIKSAGSKPKASGWNIEIEVDT